LAEGEGRHLSPCLPGESCVSTSSFKSPSQYLPPMQLPPGVSEDAAVAELAAYITAKGGRVLERLEEDGMGGRYLRSEMAFRGEVDDVEWLFVGGGAVCFRAASREARAAPPGCLRKGCINGPRNRARMEEVGNDLGWLPLETDEDKEWVQLLLH